MTIRVSAVVPTYRRPELLARCLDALARQDLDARAFEILVCDDASSDDTHAQVRKWATQQPIAIRYVRPEKAHGPAAARNAGWRAARGAIIAFTDDDTIPDTGWLRAGLAAFEDGADALWGRLRVPLPDRPTDYERNEAGLETAGFVTANCFCRRRVLEEIGGFDERFTAAWREDADLYFTLLEDGYVVRHAPEAVVVHPVRAGRWAISLRQQRKSLFNALLYKKHPRLYRQVIQPAPPGLYYAIILCLLAAAGALLAGAPILAASAAACWWILTGTFCLRRLRGTSHAPVHIAEMAVTSALIPPLSVYWRLRGALRFRVVFL